MGPLDTASGDLQTYELEAHGRTVRMVADPTDHIGRKIAAGRFYERDLLEDARMRMGPGTVIDVGAHIGNHTAWFGAVCDRRVVALEPNEASFAVLAKNARINALSAWLNQAAAGAVEGMARIASTKQGNSGMTQVADDPQGTVRIVTVDSLQVPNVALLKVDVEGCELGVLMGAAKTLRESKPLVYVEAETEERRQDVDDYLRPLGYRCIGEFGRTPTWGYQT